MADKYAQPTFGGGASRGTRKGVKANHASEKLITVTDEAITMRVRRSVAEAMISKGGWRYCPKKFKPG
jgi:hypothetical protein